MRDLVISLLLILTITMGESIIGGYAQDDPEDVEIVLMGDMVFDGAIGGRIDSQGKEYPFELIKPHIKESDIILGNLETPIPERGDEEIGKRSTLCPTQPLTAARST